MKGATPNKLAGEAGYLPKAKYIMLAGIALLTFFCYHYSLGNQFTNWDDQRFIPENIFIKSFSPTNLKMMLFHDVTGDYYYPVTIISYAINYHFSGLSPGMYYLINILLHIANSCLVFFLVLTILKSMEKSGYGIFKWKEWLAFFCTLAYAIHPMHVESVSWIAERKDVLYAFFYFLGMIAYIRFMYAEEKKRRWFLLVLVCFLLSLFSKPMAVVFPFSLLAIDILLKRDETLSVKNILLEKSLLIIISIASLALTYHLQVVAGSIQEHSSFSFFHRILFASYGFCKYILKALIPIPQSAYYPYPDPTGPSGELPFVYYLMPLICLLLVAIPLYLSYRSGKNNFRVVLFGVAFYFFNMIIVSQIVGSGPTMMADRYTYVCYFGIFFPLTYFVYRIIEKDGLVTKILAVVVSIYMFFFAFLCYERTLIWHSSETLWLSVIRQYPNRIIKAYNNLGNYYFASGDLTKAYENYKEAIDLKTGDPQVYCNMGSLLGAKGDYPLSLQYYTTALKLDSNDAVTYLDRAITYSAMGRYALAVKDYNRSAHINPNSEILLRNTAYTYLNAHQFDSAIKYYTEVINVNPSDSRYFHYRGVAEYDKGSINSAREDFLQDLSIAPHDSEGMFYLSITYNRLSNFNDAYKYAQMAQNAQYPVPDNYLRLLKARLDIP